MRYKPSSKHYSAIFLLLKIFPRVKENSSLWSTSLRIKTFPIQLWRRLNKPLSSGQCSRHFVQMLLMHHRTCTCVRRTLALFSRICCTCCEMVRYLHGMLQDCTVCLVPVVNKEPFYKKKKKWVSSLSQDGVLKPQSVNCPPPPYAPDVST